MVELVCKVKKDMWILYIIICKSKIWRSKTKLWEYWKTQTVTTIVCYGGGNLLIISHSFFVKLSS